MAVLIEYRLMTEGQTDTESRCSIYTALAKRRTGKNYIEIKLYTNSPANVDHQLFCQHDSFILYVFFQCTIRFTWTQLIVTVFRPYKTTYTRFLTTVILPMSVTYHPYKHLSLSVLPSLPISLERVKLESSNTCAYIT